MELIIRNALRRTRGDRVYYFGSMKCSDLREASFVPVIETSPRTALIELNKDGYQRPGSMPRMRKFAEFLRTNPNKIVPPVILSDRGQWKFSGRSGSSDEIGDLIATAPAAIIDGQHRLGGFVLYWEKDKEDLSVDFILIAGLSLNEERAEFVAVNDNQQGVPRSLSSYLSMDNDEVTNPRTKSEWTQIAWNLSTREDSPFVGMIARVRIGPEHLFALHSVAGSVEKMFSHGFFSDMDLDEKVNITVKYWNLIQDLHQEQFSDVEKLGVRGQGRKAFEWKLLELTGFIAWSLIGTQIISNAIQGGIVNWDDVEDKISFLSDKIDWRKSGQYAHATGAVGGPIIKRDMESVLARRK